MFRIMIGYLSMIISSAAIFSAAVPAYMTYNSRPFELKGFFTLLFSPLTIMTFAISSIYSAIYSLIPFVIFAVIAEIKQIKYFLWYFLAALFASALYLIFPKIKIGVLPLGLPFTHDEIIFFAVLAIVQSVVGSFAYWLIAGRFSGDLRGRGTDHSNG